MDQVLTVKEKAQQLKSFEAINVAGNGSISRQEMLNAQMKIYPNDKKMAKRETDKIFNFVDFDKSNTIDFSGTLPPSHHPSQSTWWPPTARSCPRRRS